MTIKPGDVVELFVKVRIPDPREVAIGGSMERLQEVLGITAGFMGNKLVQCDLEVVETGLRVRV